MEVIALSLVAESEGIDNESWLFAYKQEDCKSEIPNLSSRRQFNDRRKTTGSLCEEIRKLIAGRTDGGEDYFYIDSRHVEVCQGQKTNRNYIPATYRPVNDYKELCQGNGWIVYKNHRKNQCTDFPAIHQSCHREAHW